jgi:hypothetical protein
MKRSSLDATPAAKRARVDDRWPSHDDWGHFAARVTRAHDFYTLPLEEIVALVRVFVGERAVAAHAYAWARFERRLARRIDTVERRRWKATVDVTFTKLVHEFAESELVTIHVTEDAIGGPLAAVPFRAIEHSFDEGCTLEEITEALVRTLASAHQLAFVVHEKARGTAEFTNREKFMPLPPGWMCHFARLELVTVRYAAAAAAPPLAPVIALLSKLPRKTRVAVEGYASRHLEWIAAFLGALVEFVSNDDKFPWLTSLAVRQLGGCREAAMTFKRVFNNRAVAKNLVHVHVPCDGARELTVPLGPLGVVCVPRKINVGDALVFEACL